MVKKTCSVTLAILLCSGMVFAQQPVEWTKVNSLEGRFSVELPSKPEPGSREVDSAVGKLMLYTFAASNKTGHFLISYADYPNEPASAAQKGVLDGVTSGVIKGLEAELITETTFSLRGYPGREFRAKRTVDGNEVIFSWKTLLAGRRLYQMGVVTAKADAESPDIQKFFTSFQLAN
jgi:hypothetical protein